MLKLIAVASIALMVVACGGSKSGSDTTPLVVAASTATPRPCGDEAAIETVRPSVVRVSTEDGSIGTGIIVAENRVLTNAHVVEGSTTVRVESQSGAVEGSVIGSDSVIDVALIQAPTRDLPVVAWAEPSELRAGQRLLALGYALDLPGEPSSTGGIFSALRTLEGIDYLQTDTPINPGNSGGPLFTQCGEIVGLNTFTLSDADLDLQGLGFAIRSSVLKSAISDLGSAAYAERPPSAEEPTDVPDNPGSAAADNGPSAPTPVIPAPAPVTRAPRCGDPASITLTQPSLSIVYHDDSEIEVTIDYDAPGCKEIGFALYGRNDPTSDAFQRNCGPSVPAPNTYHCNSGSPGSGPRDQWTYANQYGSGNVRLPAERGTITLREYRPSPPDLDGFKACMIWVTLADGEYGGDVYQHYVGNWCNGDPSYFPQGPPGHSGGY